MNRKIKYFRCLLVFISTTAILSTMLSCGGQNTSKDKARRLGESLCDIAIALKITDTDTTNTPRELLLTNELYLFVDLNDDLYNQLANIADDIWQDYSIDVYARDLKNGDGTATHFIVIKSKGRELLGIRLKYDNSLKKFYILEFWEIDTI